MRSSADNVLSDDRWQLPGGWQWSTMGDVAEVVGGGTPPTSDPTNYGGDIPWITPADLSGYVAKTIARGGRSITQKGLENSGARVMPAGTVLFSSRAPIGYVAIAANPVSTNQGFKSFVLKPGLVPDFVYYYLQRARDLAVARASGTTFLEISGAKARTIPIPVPPLPEQERIVAEIEKQFTRLDAGVDALTRLQAHLKRYRAAVLKAACEGRLVPTEAEFARSSGRAFQTGEALLAEILAARPQAWDRWAQLMGKKRTRYVPPQHVPGPDLPALPEGWCWATWDQIGFSQNGRAFPSSDYADEGVRLLRPGNLHASGRVEWTEKNERCLPQKYAEEFPEFLIRAGELVMNLTAQSLKDDFLGRICMTGPEEKKEPCLLNQRQARLSPTLMSSRYLFWVLKSPLFRRFVDGLNTGSLIQHMFTSQLAEFALPLPPFAEQERIIAEVERHFSIVEQAEAAVVHGLARGRALRTAILAAAFEGRLVERGCSEHAAIAKSRSVTSATAPSKPVRSRNRASAPGV